MLRYTIFQITNAIEVRDKSTFLKNILKKKGYVKASNGVYVQESNLEEYEKGSKDSIRNLKENDALVLLFKLEFMFEEYKTAYLELDYIGKSPNIFIYDIETRKKLNTILIPTGISAESYESIIERLRPIQDVLHKLDKIKLKIDKYEDDKGDQEFEKYLNTHKGDILIGNHKVGYGTASLRLVPDAFQKEKQEHIDDLKYGSEQKLSQYKQELIWHAYAQRESLKQMSQEIIEDLVLNAVL